MELGKGNIEIDRGLDEALLLLFRQSNSFKREIAINRMIKQAEEMGANAIVGLRLGGASIMQGASEILAYGTVVIIED